MTRTTLFPQRLVVTTILALLTAAAVRAQVNPAKPASPFLFKDADGKSQSVPVVSDYYPKKLQLTPAKVDRSLDPKLMRAATIAEERAHAHSRSRCWQYVKEALLASGAVNS